MEDCEPRTGYHRSLKNEIFRCETGPESNGVWAFTEAGGDTDYSCGFDEQYRPQSWGGGMRGDLMRGMMRWYASYVAVNKVLNNFH